MCRNYKRKGNIRLQKKDLAEKNSSVEIPYLAEKTVITEKNRKSEKNILAVIGGMGSGKSTVLSILEQEGQYERLEMDRLAKNCYLDSVFLKELSSVLPKDVFTEKGELNFPLFRALLLKEESYRKAVEERVHPLVFHMAAQAIFKARKEGMKLAVETALPNEAFLSLCDAVLYVDCPFETRLSRLTKNRGYRREEAERMIKAQDIEKYKERADFVLLNDGNIERTEDAIRQFIQRF